MIHNVEYWKNRYKNAGGPKTVGLATWTDKQYQEENKMFLDKVTPVMEQGKTVLDFGCGIARFYPLLSQYFDTYYGADLATAAIDAATAVAPEGIFQQVTGDSLFPDVEYFDTIWTCVVLQHVIDDGVLGKVLDYFAEKTISGSRVIITDDILVNPRPPGHIRYRGIKFFETELSARGFEMVETVEFPWGNEPHAIMKFIKK